MEKKIDLIFIPAPGVGHMVSMVEMAKLIVARDHRLSITVLVMKRPGSITDLGSFAKSLSIHGDFDQTHIRFIDLPEPHPDSVAKFKNAVPFFASTVEVQKPIVREAIATEIIGRPDSGKFAGILVDMFCASLVDVAKEFDVPSYIYIPSGASFLGLMYYMNSLRDEQGRDESEFMNSDADAILNMPIFSNPFPAKLLPLVSIDKGSGSTMFLDLPKKFSLANGIVVNTVAEIESRAISVLSGDEKVPPIYPVGPILNHNKNVGDKHDEIMRWLDNQPPSSVVFLCFGSMGTFSEAQVKEIAVALERSRHRFLWSLRRPSIENKPTLAKEYDDPTEVLPEGFLERTGEMGKLIGWAPQVEVLSHKAVGGFVSHCGWNSTLESLWCGVPVATWPLYAEQQMNAFIMVKELEVAVEVKMDYRKSFSGLEDGDMNIVAATVIENAIRRLMEVGRSDRVKKTSQECRSAVIEGGSSYVSLGRFIDDVINNVSIL
ncbi:anthocyanidin 3-O-glucosyltransferase 2-like [Impatiens glandulifera]|uniref:anthocyanidin 3-O-glucosyltransferase 2-like n=1 Tax=Impatiens glandulifera TaxID=253017 RepID=UPI001FB1028C|nr:anthocyanidin 3-O-glucosyltransferase 2-like [Impatiens glandulifera]